MANTFVIPLLNPFRFVNTNPGLDPRYNTLPFDYQVDQYSYFQKWQTNDTATIQVLSDFSDLSFDFYTCDGIFFRNVPINPVDFAILGVTFTAYEAEVDFHLFPENVYIGVLSYTDQLGTKQFVQTSPLDVAVKHEGTLLYEAKSSYNDKGIIFDTGIVINIRVEGLIREFTPSSSDQEYIDQNYNATQLNSIPYRVFTNYIGCARGLPDWIIDKMNLIFSLNQVQIDGTYYSKADGGKFEMVRPSQTIRHDGYTSIKIIESDNFFLQQFKTGTIPSGDLIVIKKAKIIDDIAASFSVAGIFTTNSNLIRVVLTNKGLDAFTVLFGTTPGASDISAFDISADSLMNNLGLGYPFHVPTTVYVTVPDGVNLKFAFDWNQYDAAVLNPPTTGNGGFVRGVVYTYEELTPGDFALDWDVATGLGKRDFVGCVLSGTSGTVDRANKYSRGWDRTVPADRQQEIGAAHNLLTIERSMLPAEGIELFSASVNNTRGDIITESTHVARAGNSSSGIYLNYELLKGTPGVEPTLGLSAKLGSGDAVDISPDSISDVKFVYLGS